MIFCSVTRKLCKFGVTIKMEGAVEVCTFGVDTGVAMSNMTFCPRKPGTCPKSGASIDKNVCIVNKTRMLKGCVNCMEVSI